MLSDDQNVGVVETAEDYKVAKVLKNLDFINVFEIFESASFLSIFRLKLNIR